VNGKKVFHFRAKGIYLFAQSYGAVTVRKADGLSPRYFPAYAAKEIRDTIHTLYSKEASALLCALLTGYKGELTDGDQDMLSRTGLSHVVSVSGMHISFLAGIFFVLFGKGGAKRAILQLILLLFFALMTGSAPGTLRAFILCSAFLLAPLFGRKADALTALFAALFFLLLLNPFSIASAGLQFSFAATLGIYLLGQPLYQHWRGQLPKKWPILRAMFSFFLSILAISLGALLFTLPLSAIYFGQVSLIAPITNLLTSWAVAATFYGGILSVLVAWIYFPVAYIIAALVQLPISAFFTIGRLFQRLPFAAFTLQSVYFLFFLVFLYAILCLCIYAWQRGTRRFLLPFCALVFAFCLSALLTSLTVTRSPLTFTVLDVGQGQSILVSSGSYRALIDCGGTKEAGTIAAKELYSNGNSSLDLLILTHYHDDHQNGVLALMEQVKVKTLALPDSDRDLINRQEVEAKAREQGCEIWYITEETQIPFGFARLHLYPPLSMEGDNEKGLSILCSHGQWEALVTGDMGSKTEGLLLSTYDLPDIELLVLGHHGSRYSTSLDLLERLKPEEAIVSVGPNPYGHPAEETLDRLADQNITVYRTDHMGTVRALVGAGEDS
jgi:competence protein ComEC